MFEFNDIKLGKLTATVNVWSPTDASHYGLCSWSLKTMYAQEDVIKNRALAEGLRYALNSIDAKIAYAPSVAQMSANVIRRKDMWKNKIVLGETDVYRNPELPADGIFLKPNEAFIMSAAGCPLIIASSEEHMIVAHAGRDSLIERNAVLGKPSRQHFSIVYTIIKELVKNGAKLDEIRMLMMFAVPTELFEHNPHHPDYGEYNRALVELIDRLWRGCALKRDGVVLIDMESLFIAQALEMGVRHACATHSLREFPELAHTRDGKDASRRNLFVVKRNA